MGLKSIWTKLYQTLASVKTGIFLIIIVGLFSAVGTVILQRPTSEPDEIQRAYTPETLALLDRLGLTDIFHAWWFLALLILFCICLIFVTLDRWPNAWKVYAKPVRFAAPHFRLALPQSAKFAVADEAAALSKTERVLGRFGFRPQQVNENGEKGLFAEKQRYSVFAVYVVHLSLLCIFAGYIVDGIVGFRGNVNIPEGKIVSQITVSDNHGSQSKKPLPFSIRCDGAGMEAYPDGSPKKWWSKLAIVEDGKDVVTKTIVVNDPLVYKGLHIYQSSMFPTQIPKGLIFDVTPKQGGAAPEKVTVPFEGKATLADGESLSIAHFIPEYYEMDNQIYKKSDDLTRPAAQLQLTNAKGEVKTLWSCYGDPNCAANAKAQDVGYTFAIADADVTKANVTGLEVSHHPGQLGIWIGVVLMAIGLVVAFYLQHVRIWAAVSEDGKGGKLLWIGGMANKNRDKFQIKFEQIKAALTEELGVDAVAKKDSSKQVHKNEEKTLSPV
jgi:cytochrome c biogenesis protein